MMTRRAMAMIIAALSVMSTSKIEVSGVNVDYGSDDGDDEKMRKS